MCQGAIAGATEEPERGRMTVSWESALEKRGREGGSVFPQNNKLPSPYIILDTFPILPQPYLYFLTFQWRRKWKIGQKWNSGICISNDNEAPCGSLHFKSS